MPKQRSEISEEDRWNLLPFYASWKPWEEELGRASQEIAKIPSLRPEMQQGIDGIAKVLHQVFELRRSIERLATYAHLRHDEDTGDDHNKGYFQRATILLHRLEEAGSWIEPDLLALSNEQWNAALEHPSLAEYRVFLGRVRRKKPHTLSAREEQLVAMASKALSVSSSAFSMLENADFRFRPARDSSGKERELTLGSYSLYQRSPDRTLRQSSFEELHGQFQAFSNTFCELLHGQVQAHLYDARAHSFSSCMEEALFPNEIDPFVYRNLLKAVRDELKTLHSYIALRKRTMGLEKLYPYDLSVPLILDGDRHIDYDEASRLVVESVQPLGEGYQRDLKLGLSSGRWVDRYENQGKRSGAYSNGCYDSAPYILLNYTGTLRDVLTLAHEAGHSMHSLLSRRKQPYQYADYSIFVAEVASTFNEELLFRRLVSDASSEQERLALIAQKVEDIRGTLFRQTLFAEFELWIHEQAEAGEPFTPSRLKEKYVQLNIDYYGPDLAIPDVLSIEWARIPHFYYNFYVYQYATGISAALYLVEKVLQGGDAEREAYLNFLSSGSSAAPIDLLLGAGVDMRTKEPVQLAIHRFKELTDALMGKAANR